METHRDVALTIGAIARELGEPIHRIEYVIRTRGIEPECLAGHIRVFGADVVERIAEILRGIDRAHAQDEAATRRDASSGHDQGGRHPVFRASQRDVPEGGDSEPKADRNER